MLSGEELLCDCLEHALNEAAMDLYKYLATVYRDSIRRQQLKTFVKKKEKERRSSQNWKFVIILMVVGFFATLSRFEIPARLLISAS